MIEPCYRPGGRGPRPKKTSYERGLGLMAKKQPHTIGSLARRRVPLRLRPISDATTVTTEGVIHVRSNRLHAPAELPNDGLQPPQGAQNRGGHHADDGRRWRLDGRGSRGGEHPQVHPWHRLLQSQYLPVSRLADCEG